MKQLWVKKYAPTSFADFCFSDASIKKAVRTLIAENDIPQLLLVGDPGTGKSTLARLLIAHNNIDPIDTLVIDASLENNVDTVRDKIWTFVTTAAFSSDFKVVLLEEFDHMSIQSQSTLREMMVRYSDDVRFILTANYGHKIIDAIVSRCQTYTFSSMPVSVATRRLIQILEAEGIDYDIDDLQKLVTANLPDLRKMINIAQQLSSDGVLVYRDSAEKLGIREKLVVGDFQGLLNWVIAEGEVHELSAVYTTLFNSIIECEAIAQSTEKFDKALIAIAKYQSQHAQSADPAICVAATFSELRLIAEGKL